MRPSVLNKARRLTQIPLQNMMATWKPCQISSWGWAAEIDVGCEVALRDDRVEVAETGLGREVVLIDDDVDVAEAHLNTLR